MLPSCLLLFIGRVAALRRQPLQQLQPRVSALKGRGLVRGGNVESSFFFTGVTGIIHWDYSLIEIRFLYSYTAVLMFGDLTSFCTICFSVTAKEDFLKEDFLLHLQ